MSFICSSNAALENIKGKANDIASSIKGDIDSARAAIQSKVNSLKDSLLDIKKPEIPGLRSFKEDLFSLVGKTGKALSDAKIALNNTWGGIVSDLDTLISKVTDPLSGFDFCKDAPNVKAKPGVDGKLEKIPSTQESPTPNEEPVEAAPVTKTVKDSREVPSETGSGISEKSSAEEFQLYKNRVNSEIKPLRDSIRIKGKQVDELNRSSAIQKALGKNEPPLSQFDNSPETRLRKGMISQVEYSEYKVYRQTLLDYQREVNILTSLIESYDSWKLFRANLGTSSEINLRRLDSGKKSTFPPAYSSYFDKPEIITREFSESIRRYYLTSKKT